MASAEKYSSGNASENFSVIFIKIVWFSTSNTIKTSVWFFFLLQSSILYFKERATIPFCEEIAQVIACGTVLCLWPELLVMSLSGILGH